jgi:hypothetical protein
MELRVARISQCKTASQATDNRPDKSLSVTHRSEEKDRTAFYRSVFLFVAAVTYTSLMPALHLPSNGRLTGK